MGSLVGVFHGHREVRRVKSTYTRRQCQVRRVVGVRFDWDVEVRVRLGAGRLRRDRGALVVGEFPIVRLPGSPAGPSDTHEPPQEARHERTHTARGPGGGGAGGGGARAPEGRPPRGAPRGPAAAAARGGRRARPPRPPAHSGAIRSLLLLPVRSDVAGGQLVAHHAGLGPGAGASARPARAVPADPGGAVDGDGRPAPSALSEPTSGIQPSGAPDPVACDTRPGRPLSLKPPQTNPAGQSHFSVPFSPCKRRHVS